MSEKTTLLPSAPQDFDQSPGPAAAGPSSNTAIPMPRVIIMPGLEFDPSRKYRYGHHALLAAALIFVSFILIEMRDCSFGPGIDLDRLQALHVALMVFAFVLYLLSLFGIADFIFKFKIFFLVGVLAIYALAFLMIWMTYEAAVNPCVKTSVFIPVDATLGNKNVFSRADVIGIITLLADIVATVFMFSAASNFYKRY